MTFAGPDEHFVDYQERGQVRIVADAEALAAAAIGVLRATVLHATRDRGSAFVALSGGSTPKRMGELLAGPPHVDAIDWARLHVFWGDERWVPLVDPESNAGEAKRGFLDHVAVPTDQVHVYDTSLDDPGMAATRYEQMIRSTVPARENLPCFDLVFLGMGDDGHTASLFPGTPAVRETTRLAVANPVSKLDATRLTLTPSLINAARHVVFLVGGAGKADMLHKVLDGPGNVDLTPSQIVRPTAGSLVWLIDNAAAAKLDRVSNGG